MDVLSFPSYSNVYASVLILLIAILEIGVVKWSAFVFLSGSKCEMLDRVVIKRQDIQTK